MANGLLFDSHGICIACIDSGLIFGTSGKAIGYHLESNSYVDMNGEYLGDTIGNVFVYNTESDYVNISAPPMSYNTSIPSFEGAYKQHSCELREPYINVNKNRMN
jgi:hypothetical protein